MTIIILIIILAFALYRSNLVGRFLEHFELEDEPQPDLTEREQLELEAGYILSTQGKDERTVKSMSDEMLIAIIKRFLISNEVL